MTKTESPSAQSTEQKLSAVIEAQVRGGYFKWDSYPVERLNFSRVISILLDPQGLKAAYPGVVCETCNADRDDGDCGCGDQRPYYQQRSENAAHKILDAWLESGSDGAIDTAYELLPSAA